MADDTKRRIGTQTPEELRASAAAFAREQGLDFDEVLKKAAAHLTVWEALPQEERDRLTDYGTREWLGWEATVDDMGNTLNLPEEELERRRQEAFALWDARHEK